MPSRNRKSMARESEPEPTNLVELLCDAHWEIKSLLREMEDILDLPTAIFELYPRISIALEAHEVGETFSLYRSLRDIPDFLSLARKGEEAHFEIDGIVRRLNEIPFRKDQIRSSSWKQTFRKLSRKVMDHISFEEEEVFPSLSRLLAPVRLDALGEQYKRGLRGELGPLTTIRDQGEQNASQP